MEDFWNQGWFVLQLAWDRARYRVGDNITPGGDGRAIFLLLWVFLSPRVRNRSNEAAAAPGRQRPQFAGFPVLAAFAKPQRQRRGAPWKPAVFLPVCC